MEPRNRYQGMNSASLCNPGRYDNPIPTRFLGPIDSLKIPAQDKEKQQQKEQLIFTYRQRNSAVVHCFLYLFLSIWGDFVFSFLFFILLLKIREKSSCRALKVLAGRLQFLAFKIHLPAGLSTPGPKPSPLICGYMAWGSRAPFPYWTKYLLVCK